MAEEASRDWQNVREPFRVEVSTKCQKLWTLPTKLGGWHLGGIVGLKTRLRGVQKRAGGAHVQVGGSLAYSRNLELGKYLEAGNS